MKSERNFPRCTITEKGARWAASGHPWIYEAEVLDTTGPYPPGTLVDAVSEKGKYLGTGFYNQHSRIRIRLLSRNANECFDEAFWRRRVQWAWNYRKSVMGPDTACCRVIFGEADGFPGLTVDRFGPLLVTQTLSAGIERLKETLFPLLVDLLRADGADIRGLFERNDSALREKEGLAHAKGWFPLPRLPVPDSAVTEIEENGLRYAVDVENGQKTGFFLDQKYNRRAVAERAAGKRVLDCFTHTGSFALNAARGGAEYVMGVDISESAIAAARDNAERNGLSECVDFVTDDIFDLLPRLENAGLSSADRFQFIILDPPAFTKSRRTARNAERGYREINQRAMKLLPRGGYLATCSCSHFMPTERFEQMLRAAAQDAQVTLRQIEARQQAPDHPILWNVPESDYLKFYIFQVI